jgi:hypothetical protein
MTKLSSTFRPVVIIQINDCKQEAPTKPVQALLDELRSEEYEVTRLTKGTRMFEIRHSDEGKLLNKRDELRSNPLVLEAHSDREPPKDVPKVMSAKKTEQS